ncbi:MAG: hypothetical protein WCI92_13805 [Bacteroidota bacterium]
METENVKFDSWCIVELFGHNVLAGKVTEQVICGQAYVRIDVPKTSKCPAFTRYQLPTSIYGMTPVEEDYACRMAEQIQAQPVTSYAHNQVISELIREKLQEMAKKSLVEI